MSAVRAAAGAAFALLGLIGPGCGGGGGGGEFDQAPPAPPVAVNAKLFGLNLGPYVRAGQDPNQGSGVPADQLDFLVRDAAQYARWVRTFGTTGGLEHAGAVAHRYGLKAAIGAYLGPDESVNQAQVAGLVAAAKAGEVDLAIVGNEVLLARETTGQGPTEDQLLATLQQVRQQIPAGIGVTTVDTWDQLEKHPRVLAAVDVVLANIYPFYENRPVEQAVAALAADYQRIRAAAGSKAVWIAETGWPSQGAAPSTAPNAVPSPENQASYFLAAVRWARAQNVALLWFSAFDEPWKAGYGDYASWGILDSAYRLKPGLEDAFANP